MWYLMDCLLTTQLHLLSLLEWSTSTKCMWKIIHCLTYPTYVNTFGFFLNVDVWQGNFFLNLVISYMYRYFALIRTLPSTYFQTMLLAPVDLFIYGLPKMCMMLGLKLLFDWKQLLMPHHKHKTFEVIVHLSVLFSDCWRTRHHFFSCWNKTKNNGKFFFSTIGSRIISVVQDYQIQTSDLIMNWIKSKRWGLVLMDNVILEQTSSKYSIDWGFFSVNNGFSLRILFFIIL